MNQRHNCDWRLAIETRSSENGAVSSCQGLGAELPAGEERHRSGGGSPLKFIRGNRPTNNDDTSKCNVGYYCENLLVADLVGTHVSEGVGIIAPADEESQKLVKELIGTLQVDDTVYRAWAKGERGKYTYVSVKLPAALPADKVIAGKALQVLLRHILKYTLIY